MSGTQGILPVGGLDPHTKHRIALRYWLQGAGRTDPRWYEALRAMEFGAKHHVKVRKDGFTPEFSHQIAIAHHVRTLADLRSPQDTVSAVFLHDVREDYDVGDEEIRAKFGAAVADPVERLTKVFRGQKKDTATYFGEIAGCPVASVVKGADRIHNLSSMVGVFTREKQASYVEEGETWFLPMLKEARRNFPDQERAYENLLLTLRVQIATIKGLLAA